MTKQEWVMLGLSTFLLSGMVTWIAFTGVSSGSAICASALGIFWLGEVCLAVRKSKDKGRK